MYRRLTPVVGGPLTGQRLHKPRKVTCAGMAPTCVDPDGAIALVVHRKVLRVGARYRDPHAVPRRKAVGGGQQHKAHPALTPCADRAWLRTWTASGVCAQYITQTATCE